MRRPNLFDERHLQDTSRLFSEASDVSRDGQGEGVPHRSVDPQRSLRIASSILLSCKFRGSEQLKWSQAIVTRCLCEQLSLGTVCGIDCAALEPRGPQDSLLSWEEFTGKLINPQRKDIASTKLDALLLVAVIVLLICSK